MWQFPSPLNIHPDSCVVDHWYYCAPKLKSVGSFQVIPPYNGFGSLEDSLQNCFSLIPKPPKKDLLKLLENDHKVLRYIAKLVRICSPYIGVHTRSARLCITLLSAFRFPQILRMRIVALCSTTTCLTTWSASSKYPDATRASSEESSWRKHESPNREAHRTTLNITNQPTLLLEPSWKVRAPEVPKTLAKIT